MLRQFVAFDSNECYGVVAADYDNDFLRLALLNVIASSLLDVMMISWI